MFPIKELKQMQIQLAKKIKDEGYRWDSVIFRHQHIVYCQLRGKSREQIEKPADNNKPNEDVISRMTRQWEERIDRWKQLHELTKDIQPEVA